MYPVQDSTYIIVQCFESEQYLYLNMHLLVRYNHPIIIDNLINLMDP